MVVETSTAPSHTLYYWGEGGQYGPFDVQQDGEWAGWPNFGQVMRYFRKRVRPKLSAKAFGVLYGQAVNADESAVGERWILEMELENKVPVDMNKRKTIARLLHIPPMLFGLAMLEDMTLQPHPQASQTVATGQTKLVRVAIDTSKYQNNARTIWRLHETSSAQDKLGQLGADIRDLESYEQQSQGDLRYHVQEILLSDHILASQIVADQGRFSLGYHHANEAVRIAKSMNDSDLLAMALFKLGVHRLEWGLYGTMEQGVFQVQQDKISAALRDFNAAQQVFPSQDGKDSMHPQLRGYLATYRYRAQAALTLSKGQHIPASRLLALDDIAETVGQQYIDDLYTRTLVMGSAKGWHHGAYLSGRATVFIAAGQPGQAVKELNVLERLTEQNYPKDATRQFAWLDILRANTYMGLGEFGTATDHARRALLACQDISSVSNIAIITDIYGRLRRSDYKSSGDVQELGDILRESPLRLI